MARLLALMMLMSLSACDKAEKTPSNSLARGSANTNSQDAKGNVTPSDVGSVKILEAGATLPPCDSGIKGTVYYVTDSQSFMFCSGESWVPMPVQFSRDEKGDRGEKGDKGAPGDRGEKGEKGTSGFNSLVDVAPEAAGANCANGGQKIAVGLDTSANGVLEASEVTSVSYVCHGANGVDGVDGVDGANGLLSLVKTSTESKGANCAGGGIRIQVGIDLNANGQLDDNEIQGTSFACNGADGHDGADGADGRDGIDGVDGRDGEDGIDGVDGRDGEDGIDGSDGRDGMDGENGFDSLIKSRVEPAGSNCGFGGLAFEMGLDRNRNGVLDESEISERAYICEEAYQGTFKTLSPSSVTTKPVAVKTFADGGAIILTNDCSNGDDCVLHLYKIDAAQAVSWHKSLGSINESVKGLGLAFDEQGRIVVAGKTRASLNGQTLSATSAPFVTVYDLSGNQVSTRIYNELASLMPSSFYARSGQGMIFAGGAAGEDAVMVAKINGNGDVAWTKTITAVGQDARDVALDASGAAYVVYVQSAYAEPNVAYGALYDYTGHLLKLTTDGQTIVFDKVLGTVRRTVASAYYYQHAGIIVDDASNDVIVGYLTGESLPRGNGKVDVARFAQDGALRWESTTLPISLGMIGDFISGAKLAVDASGTELYLSGHAFVSMTNQFDITACAIKASTGEVNWVATYGEPDADYAVLTAALPSKSVLVVGSSTGRNATFLLKISPE